MNTNYIEESYMLKIILAALVFISFNANARDYISVVGSSTVYPFATLVAERLGENSYNTPVIESTGTGGGMKLFCDGVGVGKPDITNASRAIKDKELKLCHDNGVKNIDQVIVGLDGIAFASSNSGDSFNFTKEQLWLAIAAEGPLPKKWSDIDPDLPNYEIAILMPPPTSGTRDAWNSLVMKKGCPEGVKECKTIREDGAVVEAGENDALIVHKLNAEPDRFGIFGYSYYDGNKDTIQAHTIENVEISLESIQDGSYPISRPLYFYVKVDHYGVIPGLDAYIAEFTSEEAVEGYLSDKGLVPLANPKDAIISIK